MPLKHVFPAQGTKSARVNRNNQEFRLDLLDQSGNFRFIANLGDDLNILFLCQTHRYQVPHHSGLIGHGHANRSNHRRHLPVRTIEAHVPEWKGLKGFKQVPPAVPTLVSWEYLADLQLVPSQYLPRYHTKYQHERLYRVMSRALSWARLSERLSARAISIGRRAAGRCDPA